MHEEARGAADAAAGEEAVFLLAEKSGKTQHGEGKDIVAKDGLPAPGIRAVKQELKHAVGDAGQHTGTEAPAGAVDEDGQHTDADRAALGELKQLDVAEDLRQRHKDGALAQRAELEMGRVFHFFRPP